MLAVGLVPVSVSMANVKRHAFEDVSILVATHLLNFQRPKAMSLIFPEKVRA
jgi:hypothetical protein